MKKLIEKCGLTKALTVVGGGIAGGLVAFIIAINVIPNSPKED